MGGYYYGFDPTVPTALPTPARKPYGLPAVLDTALGGAASGMMGAAEGIREGVGGAAGWLTGNDPNAQEVELAPAAPVARAPVVPGARPSFTDVDSGASTGLPESLQSTEFLGIHEGNRPLAQYPPGQTPISVIRERGNVTEDRSQGLSGQEWLQSGGGGMSNWGGRMAEADDTSNPDDFSAAQLGIDADWRASLEDRYGTSAENAFDPRRDELEQAQQAFELAKLGQQTELAQMSPEDLANLESKPDARIEAFTFAKKILGTPEQMEERYIQDNTMRKGAPLTAKEIELARMGARDDWDKAAMGIVGMGLTQRETF